MTGESAVGLPSETIKAAHPLRGSTNHGLRNDIQLMQPVTRALREAVAYLLMFVQQNPLVAAGLFISTVTALTLLVLSVRRFVGPGGSRFARLLGDLDSAAVLMHANPDPDAMACAMAVEELAEAKDTDVTLYFPGQIRHHENRAFKTVLDLDLENIESASQIEEEEIILVDHNEPRGLGGTYGLEPMAVIDHHPYDEVDAEYVDIRPDYGSCSTIFAEYFEQLDWEPASNVAKGQAGKLSSDTATGLVYGIQTDTSHLTNGCIDADFKAVMYLYEGVDQSKLDRIGNPEMDVESMGVKARAIQNHEVRSAFAISDVGKVSNLDAIPQAADELRCLEGLNAVVVIGEKDGEIHFSARSKDDRVHIGQVCERVVEDIPLADAGGHARMAGGRFEVEHMEEYGDDDTQMTLDDFKEKLFVEMNGGE